MKRLLIEIICCMALSLPVAFSANAQYSPGMLFTEFSACRNAEKLNVGWFMMRLAGMFASIDGDNKDETAILRMIDGVQILDLSECNVADRERFTKKAANITLKDCELLMEIADDGDAMRIFVRKDKHKIREFVLLSYGEDPAMIRINGSIPIKYIDKLVEGAVKEVK